MADYYGWTWADQCFYGTPRSVRLEWHPTAQAIRNGTDETRLFCEVNGIPATYAVAKRGQRLGTELIRLGWDAIDTLETGMTWPERLAKWQDSPSRKAESIWTFLDEVERRITPPK